MQLLTIAEVSERLGLSEKAVRRRIEQGSLASIRRNNRRLVPLAEVERVRDELDFPTGEQAVGNGDVGGGGEGNATTALVVQLGKAVEVVQAETERRVNAERDRDAAIERERSERQAREAIEAELVELRAVVLQLQATPESDPEVGDDAVEPAPRREWWRLWQAGPGSS